VPAGKSPVRVIQALYNPKTVVRINPMTTEETILKLLQDLTAAAERPRQEWFDIKEVAAMTGLSDTHVRRAIIGGTLLASNMGTPDRSIYRVRYSDIEAWMEKRKAGALPPPRRKSQPAEPAQLPFSPHRRPSKYPGSAAA
jgi:excisionase family DNA binding protein